MKSAAKILSLALVIFLGTPALAQQRPVLVELFTSQGCSSCPPANDLVQKLSDESEDIFVLSWSVDYWNYLGWHDSFSKPAFTKRQEIYNQHLDQMTRFTPQIIVEGRRSAAGTREADVRAAVSDALGLARNDLIKDLSVGEGDLVFRVVDDRAADHVVQVVSYVNEVVVRPRRGENRGRTLTSINVVIDHRTLDNVSGQGDYRFSLDRLDCDKATHVAMIVQEYTGGPVVGILTRPLAGYSDD